MYAYSNSGTLAIEAVTTLPAPSNGLWCKTGTSDHLFLGFFYTVAGPGSTLSAIDCSDYRVVSNLYNRLYREMGKRQIYTTNTYLTNIGSSWENWNNNTDWQVWFLSWESVIDITAACTHAPPSGQSMQLSIGLDAVSPSPKAVGGHAMGAVNYPVITRLPAVIENRPALFGPHQLVQRSGRVPILVHVRVQSKQLPRPNSELRQTMQYADRILDELRAVGFNPTGFNDGEPYGDWEPDNELITALCSVHIPDENHLSGYRSYCHSDGPPVGTWRRHGQVGGLPGGADHPYSEQAVHRIHRARWLQRSVP